MYCYIRKIDSPLDILAEGMIADTDSIPEGFELVEGRPPADAKLYQIPTPVEIIAGMVLQLPVEKRANKDWGDFMDGCLRAIQYGDHESLAWLINGYQTTDADYLAVIAEAKQLFNIS